MCNIMHFFYDNVDIARKKLHQRIQQSPANKILFPKHTRAGERSVLCDCMAPERCVSKDGFLEKLYTVRTKQHLQSNKNGKNSSRSVLSF